MKPTPRSAEVAASEDQLVERARSHDFAAFEELVARNRSRVYSFALHALQDPAAAEQVLQATFLSAWDALSMHEPVEPFLPWLFRLSAGHLRRLMPKRTSASATRQQALARPQFLANGALAAAPGDWGSRATAQGVDALRLEVTAAYADLPTEHRAALVFRDLGDLSFPEMAKVLKTPVAVIKQRVHEARLSLLFAARTADHAAG